MKLPFIIRSRVNDQWRKSAHAGNLAAAEQHVEILQEQRDSMGRRLAENEDQFKAGREQLLRLITAGDEERQLARVAVTENTRLRTTIENLHETVRNQRFGHDEHVERIRAQYEGDLQLERQRYDDFVRDMLDRVMPGPGTSTPTRSSSPQPRSLPSRVQSAIEDVTFGNLQLEQHQENEAWKLLDNGVAPDEVAKRILAGERIE